MSKFKFGDKVHCINGDGLVSRVWFDYDVDTWLCEVVFILNNHTCTFTVPVNELTPATDWVKCSERMPELDDVKSPFTEYFVVTTSNDGDEVQRAYYIDWSSNECKWVSMNGVPIKAKVTHWMPSYTPAPPQD